MTHVSYGLAERGQLAMGRRTISASICINEGAHPGSGRALVARLGALPLVAPLPVAQTGRHQAGGHPI